MTEIARLSPYNIKDDLVRAALYREVRAGSDSWPQYEIQPDETLRPELIAHRHYGTDELKWVVLVATHLDDYRQELVSGEIIRLPPSTWIREKIRFYQSRASLIARKG